ncbi:MAG: hypothetical protein M0C28_25455 [Candidatus Moduliflexus flocculans]|nr:hypothetical protein [Candidatus Moduliflexus flocculans]
MSVHPENQEVESSGILGINLCAVTNVRVDHEAEQGSSRSEVARALARSVPRGGVGGVLRRGGPSPSSGRPRSGERAELRVAPPRIPGGLREMLPALAYAEFEANLCLALEVCRTPGLGRGGRPTGHGSAASPDLGALGARRWEEEGLARVFVNAFAANDVSSTLAALDAALSRVPAGAPVVGLLNLREDRGDRTRQWLRALGAGLARPHGGPLRPGAQAGTVRRRSGCPGSALPGPPGSGPRPESSGPPPGTAPGRPGSSGSGTWPGRASDRRIPPERGRPHEP